MKKSRKHLIKSILAAVLSVAMVLGAVPLPEITITASAADGSVSYMLADGTTETLDSDQFTLLTGSETKWTGWYAASGDMTISERVEVNGAAYLILMDGATLGVPKGFHLTGNNSLTIYGQNEGTGKLTINAVEDENAGIGGNYGEDGGTITICGGDIVVTGGYEGAGIGGGCEGMGGEITITAGTVTAVGGEYCAGIGGGHWGAGGKVTISGGNVLVTGGYEGAGIGGGRNGDGGEIIITAGTVTAQGGESGAGIGGGDCGNGGTITITGGDVTATGGTLTLDYGRYIGGAGIGGGANGDGGTVKITGGKVAATGGGAGEYGGAGIGGGNPSINLGRGGHGANVTIEGGQIEVVGQGTSVGIGGAGKHWNSGMLNIQLTSADAWLQSNGYGGTVNVAGGVKDEATGVCFLGTLKAQELSTMANLKLVMANHVHALALTVIGNGTVAGCPGAAEKNTVITLMPQPDEGCELVSLTVEGATLDETTNTFTMPDADVCIEAIFSGNSVKYLDEDGAEKSTSCRTFTDQTTTLQTGWYAVEGNITINENRLEVNGEAHLILCDGATLTLPEGIHVGSGNSLTIYAQSEENMGGLTIEGSDTKDAAGNAGIGGNGGEDGGAITINGGAIQVKPGYNGGAGIGGGLDGDGGVITINDGMITITNGSLNHDDGICTTGIGGSERGGAGHITINGGVIEIKGEHIARGIGTGVSGWGGNIVINGGTVNTHHGIVGGSTASTPLYITINGGTVNATSDYFAGIGGDQNGGNSGYVTINGGMVNATGQVGIGGFNPECAPGWLKISGGTVAATGTNGAGIGGGRGVSCNMDIIISGGVVTATGSGGGAGIGGGCGDEYFGTMGAGGNVTITGGVVTATGSDGGTGIGGGYAGPGGNVTITGGKVNAASDDGVGIGYGNGHDNTMLEVWQSGAYVFTPGTLSVGFESTEDYLHASGYNCTVRATSDLLYVGEDDAMFIDSDETLDNGSIANGTLKMPVIHKLDSDLEHDCSVSFTFDENWLGYEDEVEEIQEALEGQRIYVMRHHTNTYALDKLFYTVEGSEPVEIKDDQFRMPAGDVTVTATYKDRYPVIFKAGYDYDGQNMKTQYITEGEAYQLPNCGYPVQDGLPFLRWIVQMGDAEPMMKDPGDEIIVMTNTTVMAMWQKPEKSYTSSVDEEGVSEIKKVDDYTRVTSDTAWLKGWMVVDADVTINGRLEIGSENEAHLILCDGAILTVNGGIHVPEGKTLTIYAQSMAGDSMGTLTIAGVDDGNAGIGGNGSEIAGTIIINGGKITTTGGSYGAGIGGGNEGEGGMITIHGGKVTATGGSYGAGIGGGNEGAGGTISLGWTNADDFITATSYSGTVTFTKSFALEGTNTLATADNIAGKKLMPAHTVTITGSNEYGNLSVDKQAIVLTANGDARVVTLTVTPDTGCTLNGLTVTNEDGDAVDVTNNSFTMPMSDVTVTGAFAQINYGIATSITGNGTMSTSVNDKTATTAHYQDEVTLTMESATGYELSSLTVNDNDVTSSVDKNGICSFNMPADNVTVTATFLPIDYAINTEIIGRGSVKASVGETENVTTAHYQDIVVLTITPDSGCVIGAVSYNDGSDHEINPVDGTYSFAMPASNVTVSVTFLRDIDYGMHIYLDDEMDEGYEYPAYFYTGDSITPKVRVEDYVYVDGESLIQDTDYTVSFANNVGSEDEITEVTVTITGIGGYIGTKTTFFRIVPDSKNIAKCKVEGKLEAFYDGYGLSNVLEANVEVWNGKTQLRLGADYRLEIEDAEYYEAGQTYQATIIGEGDWGGSKAIYFKVIEPYHTVVFDAGDGTGTMESDVVTKNNDSLGYIYTLPACGFTAPAGYEFDHWEVSCEAEKKQPGDYFTAPYIYRLSDVKSITVTACWREKPTVTLSATAQAGNISISPSGELHVGDSVSLTAQAVPGYHFDGWYEGEVQVCDTLVYNFIIDKDRTLEAKYTARGEAQVDIATKNSAQYTLNGDSIAQSGGTKTVSLGDTLTLTAVDDDRFLYWQNESGKILGRSKTLSIVVTENMTITVVYKASASDGTSFVQFVSDYGQVLAAEVYGTSSKITFPIAPSKFGYTFANWVFEGTETEATEQAIHDKIGTEGTITVKPLYNKDVERFTVTVHYDGVERTDDVYADKSVGTGLNVKAPEIDGYVFQYWKRDKDIVGYSNNYFMQIAENVTLTAVYGTKSVEAIPVITITELKAETVNGVDKVIGIATRNVPDNYTVLEHGMLYGKDLGDLTTDNFVYGTNGVKRYKSTDLSNNGVFNVAIRVPDKSMIVYYRAYMKVRDNRTGNEVTYYSGIRAESYDQAISQ